MQCTLTLKDDNIIITSSHWVGSIIIYLKVIIICDHVVKTFLGFSGWEYGSRQGTGFHRGATTWRYDIVNCCVIVMAYYQFVMFTSRFLWRYCCKHSRPSIAEVQTEISCVEKPASTPPCWCSVHCTQISYLMYTVMYKGITNVYNTIMYIILYVIHLVLINTRECSDLRRYAANPVASGSRRSCILKKNIYY